MSQKLKEVLGVEDFKNVNYGATLIDENISVGYEEENMSRFNNIKYMTPKEALTFYPEILDLQKQVECDYPYLATTWINGFSPISPGLPTTFSMSKNTNNRRIISRIHGKSIATSDQLIGVRSDSVVETLFAHMEMGGKRILDKSHINDDDLRHIVLKSGSVCSHWKDNPVSIKYLVKEDSFIDDEGDEIPGYFYLLGGSKTICNPTLAIERISKNLENTTIKSVSKEYWVKKDYTDANPMVSAARICFGIIMIRNYLVYAREILKIGTILDVNKVKEIDIEDAIKDYETAFRYCKNIANIFNL